AAPVAAGSHGTAAPPLDTSPQQDAVLSSLPAELGETSALRVAPEMKWPGSSGPRSLGDVMAALVRGTADPVSAETRNTRVIAPGSESPPAPAWERAEADLGLDRSRRAEIQRRLRSAGFDPGPADGVFGQRTRAAIATWQQGRGIDATGFLDSEQVAHISRLDVQVAASARPNGDARQPASQVRQAPEGSPVAVTLHAAEPPEVDYWESGALDSWGSIARDAGSASQGNDIAGRETGIEWSIARPGDLGVAGDGLFSMAMEGR